MQRIFAIVERELRKFIRTPTLLIMSLVLPILQLVVLGNAFGGRVTHLEVAVVDEDGGPAARRIQSALLSLQTNGDMIRPIEYSNESEAVRDVRNGRVQAAVVIPPQFSRRVYSGNEPRVGLLLDNTDNFVSSTISGLLTGVAQRASRQGPTSRLISAITLAPVELYPYVPYMQYMLPGVITLGMFMSVMIGGGISYLDDKQRGVHEGYLVTPITKVELVFAQILAGSIKAAVGGVVIALAGAAIAGVMGIFEPAHIVALTAVVIATSLAFMSMMSCLVARMDNPMLPRALFGVMNTLLYFPSGAVYPVQSLPGWLKPITWFDPFTYAVHALRMLLLKGTSLTVLLPDIGFLALFSTIMFLGAVTLFRRTL